MEVRIRFIVVRSFLCEFVRYITVFMLHFAAYQLGRVHASSDQ